MNPRRKLKMGFTLTKYHTYTELYARIERVVYVLIRVRASSITIVIILCQAQNRKKKKKEKKLRTGTLNEYF